MTTVQLQSVCHLQDGEVGSAPPHTGISHSVIEPADFGHLLQDACRKQIPCAFVHRHFWGTEAQSLLHVIDCSHTREAKPRSGHCCSRGNVETSPCRRVPRNARPQATPQARTSWWWVFVSSLSATPHFHEVVSLHGLGTPLRELRAQLGPGGGLP